jgi:hypothetical protein
MVLLVIAMFLSFVNPGLSLLLTAFTPLLVFDTGIVATLSDHTNNRT